MTLRWGIVSAGKICNDFVTAFNSFSEKGDQAIVAIAARDKARATEFAKKHNISKVFNSYQDLAASKDIDVAYIGALNPQHYELAKLFLENGKHVLCEKPLCLNFKQSQSLINIAKKNKRFLMEAVWSRFSPAYLELEKQIAAGTLGDVLFVEANFGSKMSHVARVSVKELGGSTILDLGVYLLQFAQYVFKDEPINIIARGELNDDGVDVVTNIILEYSGGRRAVLNTHGKVKLWNKATVNGTNGRISLDEPFHFPTKLINVDNTVKTFPLHEASIPYNFTNSSGLAYQAVEVARCIKAGLLESPRMSHKESLILAKLMDSVRKQVGVHFDVDDMEYK